MTEKYTNPRATRPTEFQNAFTLLTSRVDRHPTLPLLSYKIAGQESAVLRQIASETDERFVLKSVGEFDELTAKETLNLVNLIAKGLIAKGIKKGDKVAITSRTRVEWTLMDFAILACGAVVIPIYETNSAAQIAYICNDAEIKFAFVENAQIAANFSNLQTVETMLFSQNAIPELVELGRHIDASLVEQRWQSVKVNEVATIVYTSGSTGTPKGVVLQHSAIVASAIDTGFAIPDVLMAEETRLLLFLPLAHVFARLVQFAMVADGQTVLGLAPDIKDLLKDLQIFKPTVLLGVPRVFEKVFNAASHKASGAVSKNLFRTAVQSAIEVSKKREKNEKLSPAKLAQHQFFDRVIYSKIRHVLGGSVKHSVCGGAPFNQEICHFFRGAGINILEGFGMTETVGPVAVNRTKFNRVGSVGLPMPGCQVAIAKDGELLLRSSYNFSAYHNNPELSSQTILSALPENIQQISPEVNATQSTWIKTGDIARLDDDGFIFITGRKKEIIVTAGGKNVSPAPLEALIDSEPIVAASVVIGEKRPFVAALITLEKDELQIFAKKNKIVGKDEVLSIANAAKNPVVLSQIQRAIDKANLTVSRAEAIRKFTILSENFSEAAGTMTPSMKIRRTEIAKQFKDAIENEIYG